MEKKIYFDHGAATPVLPEVLEEMLPYFREKFGNPQSLHDWGGKSASALEKAREKVATLIGAKPEEIIFVSSGTEANNLALKGIALREKKKGKDEIICSAIEHHSVLNPAKTLKKWGFKLTILRVDKYGFVDPEEVKKSLTSRTALVSIMHANGEVGTCEPIEEISRITREKGVLFHTDAVSSVGKIPVNVTQLGVDALSLASQGFYGPKGAGALWIRKGVGLLPLLEGGIQEEGRRTGTENVPAIVGMGKAAEIARRELKNWMKKLIPLRDRLLEKLPQRIENLRVNGHPTKRLPGNVHVCVDFVEGESMLILLNQKGVACSSGSACTSRALKASHVLLALGIPPSTAQGSLLFTLGIENTQEEVDYLLEVLPPLVEKLRKISPLSKK